MALVLFAEPNVCRWFGGSGSRHGCGTVESRRGGNLNYSGHENVLSGKHQRQVLTQEKNSGFWGHGVSLRVNVIWIWSESDSDSGMIGIHS